jgi:hypothetical protein
MAGAETQTEVREVAFEWLRIASGVAQGLYAPEEGIAMLQALAQAHPADREWLQEEAETIRHQFGLDVADRIQAGAGSYWDKLCSVIDALLDERLDHGHALALLRTLDDQHPEHAEQIAALIDGIENSPMRQYLDTED